jgi:very-short-patch-repair endonuclease
VLAVPLALGEGSVASYGTAARLYGLRAGQLEDGIEVTTERARRVRLPGVVAHRSLHLFDSDRRRRGVFPLTSPARTIVDLSGRLDPIALGRASDHLLRTRTLTLAALARCIGRLTFAPGRAPSKVHDVLRARWDGYDPGDSDLETRVLRALVHAGLPLPRQQLRVSVGPRRYYIDLAWPEVKVALEIDSWVYHQWRSRFDGDRAKRNDLLLLGWKVIQVTDAMSDDEVVAVVSAALARAA